MYKLVGALNALFMGFVVWMIYIANTGGNSVFFDIVRTTRDGDKIGHFFLYGLLALGCNITLKFRTVGRFPFCIYWGSLAVGLFTLAEEFSQAFLISTIRKPDKSVY